MSSLAMTNKSTYLIHFVMDFIHHRHRRAPLGASKRAPVLTGSRRSSYQKAEIVPRPGTLREMPEVDGSIAVLRSSSSEKRPF